MAAMAAASCRDASRAGKSLWPAPVMNLSLLRMRRPGAAARLRFDSRQLGETQQQRWREMFAGFELSVIVDFVPADIGGDVEPPAQSRDVGGIAQPLGGLLDDFAGGDGGLGGVQMKEHDPLGLGAVLNPDQRIA